MLIELERFGDQRGSFMETYRRERYERLGIHADFVQDNWSTSVRGTLRGLHHQLTRPQGKLVHAVHGEIFGAAVDIRRGSPSFGEVFCCALSADNRLQLWIPPGFAHGFVVLSERALFTYLCTQTYDRAADAAIRWDDAQLAVDWPVGAPLVSEKDAAAPFLADVPEGRLPDYRPA